MANSVPIKTVANAPCVWQQGFVGKYLKFSKMEQFIWLFPILFVFHDFEEIIGCRLWVSKNGAAITQRFPKIAFIFSNFSTEGFALAVAEELVLILIICGLTFTGIRVCDLLWLGAFIAFTLHMVVHIGQAIVLRKYIPAVATSILLLPVSVWIAIECVREIDGSVVEIVAYSFVAAIAVGANLFLAHWFAGKFNEWQRRKILEE